MRAILTTVAIASLLVACDRPARHGPNGEAILTDEKLMQIAERHLTAMNANPKDLMVVEVRTLSFDSKEVQYTFRSRTAPHFQKVVIVNMVTGFARSPMELLQSFRYFR